MIIEKKVCFILNWAREFNMYETLINQLKKKNFVFVINDLNKSIINHNIEIDKINKILKSKNFRYFFLSKTLNKKKFKIAISTGDIGISKISLKSFLRFIYARTIGAVFSFLHIDLYFKKILEKDISAGGSKATIYKDLFIEKLLAEKTIKYPNGLDRNVKYFPNNAWSNVFDIYFTSSKIEKILIKKKFKNKKIFFTGYSRFDKSNLDKKNFKRLIEEFKINKKKKTIFCCPNERIMSAQSKNSIKKYISCLIKLKKNYNIILRPHPKLQLSSPEHFGLLKSSGIKIDVKSGRNIQYLFLISDLTVVDYGSSVLEAIYLKKKLYSISGKRKIFLKSSMIKKIA